MKGRSFLRYGSFGFLFLLSFPRMGHLLKKNSPSFPFCLFFFLFSFFSCLLWFFVRRYYLFLVLEIF